MPILRGGVYNKMNTLKIRAWNPSTKTMIYPMEGDLITVGVRGELEYWYGATKCIVMLFTGLLDKQGTEIYEGDILDCNYGEFFDPHGIHYSTERRHKFVMEGKHLGDFPEWNCPVEVIGNIYEHPTLLE